MSLTVTEMETLRPPSPAPRSATPTQYLTHLPERPPVDIEFTDINYSVPVGKGRTIVPLLTYFRSIPTRIPSKSVVASLRPNLQTYIALQSGALSWLKKCCLAPDDSYHLSAAASGIFVAEVDTALGIIS